MKQIKLTHRKDRYKIEAKALLVGEDIIVSIWGGTRPHVGAVAMAVPRPSLRDPHITSSTSSVLTRVGHREDDIVKRVSETLSSELDRVAVVSAGIHWDDLTDDEIDTIRSLCDELARRLVERLQMGIE